jgi:prepilin-type N-terminal cleavage/methylation domain-containing protein
MPIGDRHSAMPARRGFTLLELLVVIGILLVLATLTGVGVTKVTRDARLAGATNTIISALGNARAIAIRDGVYVLVTFRVAMDGRSRGVPSNPQVIEIVTARWTGEVVNNSTPRPAGVGELTPQDDQWADRYLPVPGVPFLRLPPGILVAGPNFGFVTDTGAGVNDAKWATQPRFAGSIATTLPAGATIPVTTFTPNLADTEIGSGIGVLFGPDGRTLSRNPEQVTEVMAGTGNQNAWVRAYVDYDGNGFPNWGTTACPDYNNLNQVIYDEPLDEPFIDYVPYLAVFNDEEAREKFPPAGDGSPSGWRAWRGVRMAGSATNGTGSPRRVGDLSLFIAEQSDRIFFNRFTGVAGVAAR